MTWSDVTRITLFTSLLLPAGCATLSPEDAFTDVAMAVDERTGQSIQWIDGGAEGAVAATSARLLSRELTPAGAVHLALLNNHRLQARYARLGIAQADLVQAALPPNPIAGGAVTFADSGATNLAFSGALQVVELLRIPRKKRIAASQLEEVKIDAAAEVIRVVAQTQIAFIRYQAAEQAMAGLVEARDAAKASLLAAKRIRDAGNMTALDYERQAGEVITAELEISRANIRAVQARERLNELMGLNGAQTRWRARTRLPGVPAREIATADAEDRAMEISLELAQARQRMATFEQRLGLAGARGALPEGEVGGEWQRDDGTEEAGPSLATALPVFDWGQARRARARMELNRAHHVLKARRVEVQTRARALKADLLAARKTALYHQTTALPQANRLMRAAQRQHNAMQIGVFDLLRTRRNQMTAAQQQIGALADYWIARTKFLQLMRGTLPEPDEGRGGPADD